jgi:hypothetical protein
MANSVEKETGGGAPAGLEGLAQAALRAKMSGPAPVHLWNPPYCGDIGLRIARDGTWHYRGSPIGRPAMVRLFAGILRRDPERYVLVTPVEKVAVEVEDAPFLAVELKVDGEGEARRLSFRTNLDEWAEAGPEHALRFEPGPAEGVKPYVHIRGGLWALATRPVYYELVELGETRAVDGVDMFGVSSGGTFFAIRPASEIEGMA